MAVSKYHFEKTKKQNKTKTKDYHILINVLLVHTSCSLDYFKKKAYFWKDLGTDSFYLANWQQKQFKLTSCKISFGRKRTSPSSTLGLATEVTRPRSPENKKLRLKSIYKWRQHFAILFKGSRRNGNKPNKDPYTPWLILSQGKEKTFIIPTVQTFTHNCKNNYPILEPLPSKNI